MRRDRLQSGAAYPAARRAPPAHKWWDRKIEGRDGGILPSRYPLQEAAAVAVLRIPAYPVAELYLAIKRCVDH